MPNSAMSWTVMNHEDSSRDELLDVPDVGPADEPTSEVGADHRKGPGVARTGHVESLVPKIFPIYAFI